MTIITDLEWYGLGMLFVVFAIAFWRGGSTERRVAIVVTIAWIASTLIDDDGSSGPQWAIMVIDVVLGLWLLFEALFGRPLWLIFAAAGQIMIVMTHLAFAITPDFSNQVFFSAYYVWSYLVLASLLIGSVAGRKPPTKA